MTLYMNRGSCLSVGIQVDLEHLILTEPDLQMTSNDRP